MTKVYDPQSWDAVGVAIGVAVAEPMNVATDSTELGMDIAVGNVETLPEPTAEVKKTAVKTRTGISWKTVIAELVPGVYTVTDVLKLKGIEEPKGPKRMACRKAMLASNRVFVLQHGGRHTPYLFNVN